MTKLGTKTITTKHTRDGGKTIVTSTVPTEYEVQDCFGQYFTFRIRSVESEIQAVRVEQNHL